MASIKADAFHPPLDYLIDRAVEVLNPSDWVRKLPAVVWGVGTIWALALLVARRAGRAAGLIAALLLTLAPFHVRFSQELRPYSLGLFTLCLSLLVLEIYLCEPTWPRMTSLFLACLATLYALYVSAIVLFVAAAALVLSDAVSSVFVRQRAARRFLIRSPFFVAALWMAYLPWWPVVAAASARAPMAGIEPLTLARAGRTLAFFAFGMNEGEGPGPLGIAFGVVCAAGLILASRKPSTLFVTVWGVVGLAALEGVATIHPHIYATRRFLPAGLALIVAAAIALAELGNRRRTRIVGAAALVVILAADVASLGRYFRHGRADWRPMAAMLKARMRPGDRLFTPGPYEAFTLAYFASGPDWLFRSSSGLETSPEIYSLDGEPGRLNWSWPDGTAAWLQIKGDDPKYDALRRWADRIPNTKFPEAENSILVRLDPLERGATLWRPPFSGP